MKPVFKTLNSRQWETVIPKRQEWMRWVSGCSSENNERVSGYREAEPRSQWTQQIEEMMSSESRENKKTRVHRTEHCGGGSYTERMLGICRGSSWSIQLSTNQYIYVWREYLSLRKEPFKRIGGDSAQCSHWTGTALFPYPDSQSIG